MKQTVLTTPSGQEILVVEVPKEARDFMIFNDKSPYLSYFKDHNTYREYLPEVNWQGKRLEDYDEDERFELEGFLRFKGIETQNNPFIAIRNI
jgi:hypothetical protein